MAVGIDHLSGDRRVVGRPYCIWNGHDLGAPCNGDSRRICPFCTVFEAVDCIARRRRGPWYFGTDQLDVVYCALENKTCSPPPCATSQPEQTVSIARHQPPSRVLVPHN